MQRTRSAPRRCILRGSEPRGTIRPAVVAQARQQSEEESSGINTVTQCLLLYDGTTLRSEFRLGGAWRRYDPGQQTVAHCVGRYGPR